MPNPLTEEYARRLPMTVGVLLSPELREEWFEWKSESQRKRVDVPVGKLVYDYAHAGMRRAFENFYVERFYDRRSEKGLLVIIDRVDYSLQGSEVVLSTTVRIEDESKSVVLSKTYRVRGKVAHNPIVRIPFVSKSRAEILEKNTDFAFRETYRQLVLDILVLVGIVEPPPSPSPLPPLSESPEPVEIPGEGELVERPGSAEVSAAKEYPKPIEQPAPEEAQEPALLPPPAETRSPSQIPAPPAEPVSPADLPRPWEKP